jgi:selenocysteine lyase/cysteine desulfurase
MGGAYLDRYPKFSGRRKFVHAAMDMLFDYEAGLAAQLVDGLKKMPGVTIQGISEPSAMRRRVPTVSFTVKGDSPDRIAEALADDNIFVWSGHNYAVEAVRSLKILDKGGAVRIGPVHYNTSDEIHQVLEQLTTILGNRAAA